MKSKTLLITTAIITATTAAFGAASLRAPQLGGGATTPAASAPTTARAGTLRAQTMKTSSVSAPSVTTTQSIATPISTETTDARLSLLKGIKGFNPGKIKDTTAATNELNSLNDRIEELTAQLDRAEAAQSSVITEANIDAKITEKLTALGTSTGIKETYSKEEVDALLNDIKKKLPTFNDKGNMTWTDPNGNLVAVPYHWINLVNQLLHTLITINVQNNSWTEVPIADILIYHTNKTNSEIATFVSNNTCKGETSRWCIIESITPLDTDNIKEVKVLRLRHGSDLTATLEELFGYTPEEYWTFEDSAETYIKNMVCGNRPENECYVDSGHTHTWDAMGESYPNIAGQMQELTTVRINKLTRKYTDLIEQQDYSILAGQPNMATSLLYQTNMSEEEIEEYVSSTICQNETPGQGWCILHSLQPAIIDGVPSTYFQVTHFHHGYKRGNVDYITSNNTRVQNFVTIEDDAEEYILNQICGDRPSSECHLLPNHQTYCYNLSDTPRQICDVYIELSPEPGTGWYLPATPADD